MTAPHPLIRMAAIRRRLHCWDPPVPGPPPPGDDLDLGDPGDPHPSQTETEHYFTVPSSDT